MLQGLRESVRQYLDRRHHRAFLEASMAGAALVAMADGRLSFAESSRIDEIVQRVKELKAFDPHEAMDCFYAHVDAIEADLEDGQARAHEAVAAVADEPEAAELLVRICVAMSRADGHVDPAEAAEIQRIRHLLNLDAATISAGE